jgi:molybdate transport system substrate-binding protein
LRPGLRILSAGAAQGAVDALAKLNGFDLEADFGAVGAMQKRLLEGEPCDLIVLTRALIGDLSGAGRVVSSADIGLVRTGLAVREADPLPELMNEKQLREALQATEEIYFPDPLKATAGIHFAKVLEALQVTRGWKTFPNGATAMREMARSKASRVIGCTQITEIRNAPGVKLAGPLPAQFQLATVYTGGVCAGAHHPQAAQRFLDMLSAPGSAELRRKAGFDL